ncbi:hypothetical protein GCM10009804_61070 [Kribbella hippodromi]|uniref:SDR family NAD(P)-dependent oxidoreductase n=1 Tax=Kribbella hippodromi TaxID=434347 RepID=A0ABN2E7X1_9ACTN
MKTVVITGGTSGIGAALARTYVARGNQVIVIAPDPVKGQRFLDLAGERGRFIQADLSLVSENRRVINVLEETTPAIDALILCARFFRSHRLVTTEGFEHNFALFYLSRYLLSHGLADRMDQAADPVIVNVAGPGVGPPTVNWQDLGLEHNYDGWTAMAQGGRLNDLLAVSFAAEQHRTRYVLHFPGGTQTGFAGEFDPATATQIAEMKRTAQPVDQAIVPIIKLIDKPPHDPLSAFLLDTQLNLHHPTFNPTTAAHLNQLTHHLLQTHPTAPGDNS